MDLPSQRVYDVLMQKGVQSLYHANSVLTASQFLRTGALLSRGTIEREGKWQTPQRSDAIDKRHSIWFDVFTDSVDIHARARRANFYGPVLFVLDPSIVRRNGRVWVTRLNPESWSGRPRAQRWFQSSRDLNESFVLGTFDHMIVFRHAGGAVPFRSHLREVVLDDPALTTPDGTDLFSAGYGALSLALTEGGLDVPISKRSCVRGCGCRRYYDANHGRAVARFLPQPG